MDTAENDGGGFMKNDKKQKSEILLYTTPDGNQRIEVRLENETVWLSQRLMAELFQTTAANVNIHLKNIFAEGELLPDSVIKKSLITATDGKSYKTNLYCLEAIIAVGYRIKSLRGTQFRQWATERLRDYIVKGFVLDDERLAEPGGIDYFDELLERIRAIRASEKRFYRKVRDIYALSCDYNPKNPINKEFFATVQNKMLFAATGLTAAEIIHHRAKAQLPNMGLTTWKGAGRGRVLTKADIVVAKNYLTHEEVSILELLVGQFLDFAELQAKRKNIMYIKDWISKLDDFLKVNEQDILANAGKISAELAQEIAYAEYDIFSENKKLIEADQADEELKDAVKRIAHDKKTGKRVISRENYLPTKSGKKLRGK